VGLLRQFMESLRSAFFCMHWDPELAERARASWTAPVLPPSRRDGGWPFLSARLQSQTLDSKRETRFPDLRRQGACYTSKARTNLIMSANRQDASVPDGTLGQLDAANLGICKLDSICSRKIFNQSATAWAHPNQARPV
jgi:hypothetical protein